MFARPGLCGIGIGRLGLVAASQPSLVAQALAVIRSLGGDAIYVQNGFPRLWTDSAGTTPVTAVGNVIGHTVGRIGLMTATQATTANKPVVGRGLFNQFSRSHKFDDAAWGGFGSAFTRAIDTGTGPNGLDCYKITATASPGVPLRVIGATGTTVTFAVVAKVGTNVTLSFLVRNSTTATNLTATNSSVSLGNGWNLYSLVVTSGIGVGDQLSLYHGAIGLVPQGAWWLLYASGLFNGQYTAQQIIALGGIPETVAAGGWSAAGRLAMAFDGTNDFLQTGITTGNEGWVCAGVTINNSPTSFATISSNGAGSATQKGIWLTKDTGGDMSSNIRMGIGNGTSLAMISAPAGITMLNTPRVIDGGWAVDSVMIAVDGQSNSIARTGDATPAPRPLLIGTYLENVHPLNGSASAFIYTPVLPSPSQRQLIRRWVGSLQGQTL